MVVVGFALATNRGGTPPERGQALLSIYLSGAAATGQVARVVQIAAAERPTNFTRELSAYSLGHGTYYQTSEPPTGDRALRYPPDYAACVLIERGSQYEVVVLADHHDTWNADWVLHTSTLSPDKLIETLGCPLNVPQ